LIPWFATRLYTNYTRLNPLYNNQENWTERVWSASI
jgi:hypothetical protein